MMGRTNDERAGPMTTPTQADYDDVATQLTDLAGRVAGWTVPEPAPIPPELGTCWFGCSAPKGIDALEAAVGVRFAAHRTFHGGMPTSWDQHDAATDTGKRFAVVSVKWGNWKDVTGAVDACVRFGRTWPLGQPGVFILNHEPEDNGQPADFVAMQAAVTDAWHEAVPGVLVGGCLMAWSTEPASGIDPEAWIHDGWDFLSWDGYDKQSNHIEIPRRFDKPAAISAAHGLRFAIAEYGTVSDDWRGAWTADGADYAAAHDGLFCTYWNSANTGYPYPWKPADYPMVADTALTYGGAELATADAAERPEYDDVPRVDHDA